MLKPIAATLMCLGLFTLGVTALRGQEEVRKLGDPDLIAVEEKPAPLGDVVEETGEKFVDIHLGNDGQPPIAGYRSDLNIEVRDNELIVSTKDGKVVEKRPVNARWTRAVARFDSPMSEIDPATRGALEKMISDLRDETKRLESDGKKEEAEKKQHSIQALEQLLNGGPRGPGMFMQHVPRMGFFQDRLYGPEGGPDAAEMKKLHERLEQLNAQASKESNPEAVGKIGQEFAAIQKQIAERQHRIAVMAPPGAHQWGGVVAPPGGIARFRHWAPDRPEMLMRKSAALSQAADQLRGAGLQNQARDLDEQAQKLKAEAEKLRTEVQPGPGGPGGFGPPIELHRAIRELQEQVQQLRKEVGELREMLQQRRQ